MPVVPSPPGRLTVSIWLPLSRSAAYPLVVGDLTDALARVGIQGEVRPEGNLTEGTTVVATVRAAARGEGVRWDWRPAPWSPETVLDVELQFADEAEGTRVTWSVVGLDRLIQGGGPELAGWVASEVFANLGRSLAPRRAGDWMTDRAARRPSGPSARRTYGNPEYHWPNFLLLLERLRLGPADQLLEVGCGGGVFLERALESGCTAVGVDHSPDMVRLAREVNRAEIANGRVKILEGEADRLPVGSGEFSAAVLTGVFNFLPDPVGALREVHRALRPGGRLAVFAGTTALCGTPAAPEPIASRLKFLSATELARAAQRAGFVDVQVEAPDMEPFARTAGIGGPDLRLFQGREGALLLAGRKGAGVGNEG